MLGQVESLLSPSYRHVVEETRSRQMVRLLAASPESRMDQAAVGDRRAVGEIIQIVHPVVLRTLPSKSLGRLSG
ncbi:hypothetical protein [Nocardia sp. R7R-8]|uniref:hypothetical protein n=1 Tax=Nocardia sp. R7R-8 TaxID=3459304 RepID=UPI00403D7709